MKKELKKVSLFDSEGLAKMNLTDEQRAMLVSDYVEGLCYFYCLAYLGDTVYGVSDMDVDYYLTSYGKEYGPPVSGNPPTLGVSDMGIIQKFTGQNFDTATVEISNMSEFLVLSNRILAGIKISDGQGGVSDHAVVIVGYDSAKNEYRYYDPAYEQEFTKPANDFTFVLGVTGVK